MDFSAQNPATSNALNLAARHNDVNKVVKLLRTLNPNCVDNRGWTSLHEAAYFNSYESMLLILKAPGVQVLAETHEGHTALYLACKNNCSLKTIKALLESVPNIANYGSTEGVTPLHIASCQGNVKLIELLLEYGAIINVQDFDGDTPLHEAALSGQNEPLVTLLYAGADPEIPNSPHGFTAFHLACCKGDFSNVETLYPFIYDINKQTCSGETALHYAVHSGNCEIVNFLLENGADPNISNDCGEMPLDVLNSDPEVFKKILSVTDREKINKYIIINACQPHVFTFDNFETLLCSDLGPEFFNVVKLFNTDISNGSFSQTSYITHAPLNHFLYISAYIYKKSLEKFREFFYLFLMQGVNVNSLHATECPPLVYAQYVYHTEPLLHTGFKEVFNILIAHGCDVDYCSSGKGLTNDVKISDAFLTALDIYPVSAVLMMPYSVYNEPDKYLQFAEKNNLLGVMPVQVQNELLRMIDKNFCSISPELLKCYVPSLKHLCRYRIRSHFRHMIESRNGPIMEFSTKIFLDAVNELPIPTVIQKYLRYIC